MRNDGLPAVTVAIPTLNEERHIDTCLDAVLAQTYDGPLEVLVVDGGSTDGTRAAVQRRARKGVRLVDNPGRTQAPALNVALREAAGEVLVRIDGHTVVEPDYVERCVEALDRTGAAMVGGAMTPVGTGWRQSGIAAAMISPLGVGPARFHRRGPPAWTDTVYQGAFRVEVGRRAGGYAEDMAVNEDAEFAIRMAPYGGVWFEPAIRSRYSPRNSLRGLARQFYRYGRYRAVTVRRHPRSLRPRQLAAPLLVFGLLTPWRRRVLGAYAACVAGATVHRAATDKGAAPGYLLALPVMHLSWGAGFLFGLVRSPPLRGSPFPSLVARHDHESGERPTRA
ncbi:MAG: glycosyltransferase family 2 protein [Actinomycetota bacterium]|nr:glycosyltransferase family 2 protein [Actinomycetota bacterium]